MFKAFGFLALLIGVGILLYTDHPVIALLVAVPVLLYNFSPGSAAGQPVNPVAAILTGLGFCLAVHLVLSAIFGSSVLSFKGVGGLTGFIKNPSGAGAAVYTEVFTLIICGAVYYLRFTSTKPMRWVAWCAIPVSLTFLLLQNASGLTTSFNRWWASKSDSAIKTLDDSVLNTDLLANLPDFIEFSEARELFGKEPSVVAGKFDAKPIGTITVGSLWSLDKADQFTAVSTGFDFVHIMNEKEPAVQGYVPFYTVLKSARPVPLVQPPNKAPDPAIVRHPSTPVAPTVAAAPEPPKVTDVAPKRSTVKDDTLTINTEEWKDSEVVPYTGDTIEIGPFAEAKDVARILCRIGGAAVLELKPVEKWDGKFVGRIVPGKGANSLNAPLRFKLKAGDPLSVSVRKTNSY